MGCRRCQPAGYSPVHVFAIFSQVDYLEVTAGVISQPASGITSVALSVSTLDASLPPLRRKHSEAPPAVTPIMSPIRSVSLQLPCIQEQSQQVQIHRYCALTCSHECVTAYAFELISQGLPRQPTVFASYFHAFSEHLQCVCPVFMASCVCFYWFCVWVQHVELPSDTAPGATTVTEPEIWQVDDAAGDAITASLDEGQADDVILIYDAHQEYQLDRYLLNKHHKLVAKSGEQNTKHSQTSRRNTGVCFTHVDVLWLFAAKKFILKLCGGCVNAGIPAVLSYMACQQYRGVSKFWIH
jgi:hypothetical protein